MGMTLPLLLVEAEEEKEPAQEEEEVEKGDDAMSIRMHISADCSRVVSGTKGGAINIWDAGTGELIAAIEDWASDSDSKPPGFRIVAVHLSEDGKCVAANGNDGRLVLWDQLSEIDCEDEDMGPLPHAFTGLTRKNASMCICISPIGDRLVSGGCDGRVRVWSIATGTVVWTIKAHFRNVRALTMSQDGHRIASVGEEGDDEDPNIQVWDAQSGAAVGDKFNAVEWGTSALLLMSRAEGVYSGDRDGHLAIWDEEYSVDNAFAKTKSYVDCGVTSITFACGDQFLLSSYGGPPCPPMW